MTSDIEPVETLTRVDAAAELGVAVRTVDQWVKDGKLAVIRNDWTREVRIPVSAVVEVKARRSTPPTLAPSGAAVAA